MNQIKWIKIHTSLSKADKKSLMIDDWLIDDLMMIEKSLNEPAGLKRNIYMISILYKR